MIEMTEGGKRSSLLEERYCRHCEVTKPSLYFEQLTNIQIPSYRLPWLRHKLLRQISFNQTYVDGLVPESKTDDEEKRASYQEDLMRSEDMLKTINDIGLPDKNIAQGLEPYWVKIPVNHSQRKWLRWLFYWERMYMRDQLTSMENRHHEQAIVDAEGDIEMISYFLKVIDILLNDVCKDCMVTN
jgi:hypothetical protein